MHVDTIFIYSFLYVALFFNVFLLLSFFNHSHIKAPNIKKRKDVGNDNFPKVSITVPCYNEEKTLSGTLESLLRLDYPSDKLEINVVNDGSTDKTSQIAHKYAQKYQNIRAFDKENGGKASALNYALEKSTGEFIGCLDADSFVDSDALNGIVSQFVKDKQISAVTPAIVVYNPKTLLQYMQRAEYMIGVFMRKAFGIIDSIVVTPGPFSIFRKSSVLEVGPWKHAHGTEDFEMGLRLQKTGKKITNEPHAIVYTISPDTLYKLYKQRIRWVYGFLMNAWDYKSMVGNPKYGNVGMFVLPAALFSVFGAVYMFIMSIYSILSYIFEQILRIYNIGISLSIPQLDWFYVNTSAFLFIMIILLVMIVTVLQISSKISRVQISHKDTLIYFLLYGFVAPLWLTGALARAFVGAESKWKVLR